MKWELSKGTRYILLFVLGLVLLLVGTSIAQFICYFPLKGSLGISFEEYINALNHFSSYYLDEPIFAGSVVTKSEEAFKYFTDNPEIFRLIKITSAITQLVSYVLPVGALVLFLYDELKEDLKKFKTDFVRQIICLICGIGGILISSLILYIITILGDNSGTSINEMTIDLIMLGDGKWIMIFAIVFLAPICEELIFRKLLFGVFENTFKLKPVFAIIFSILVFSLIHVTDIQSLKYIYQYILLSIPICLAYHFSRNNAATSIVIHTCNNFISAIVYMVIIWAL